MHTMSKPRTLRTPHPLSGSTLRNWLKILAAHGPQIDRAHWGRAAKITAWSIAAAGPALLESLLYGRRIAQQKFDRPPVMVLGHWRSGTTNMHNLLLTDPQFASVSLLHCAIPNLYLMSRKPLGWYLSRKLPKNRPMDSVRLGLDEPMSEDFGMVGMSDRTHYSSYFFPRIAERAFRETVLFEGVGDRGRRRYQNDYLGMLKKVLCETGNRQLVLKNPPNTGRVPEVLEMFPDAKIIFVRRNPWVVHASTVRLMQRFLEKFALQDYDEREIETFVSMRMELIMKKWLADKSLIPADNLIEVRHEDVIRDQMNIVEDIYRRFDLPGWAGQQPRLQKYVDSVSDYTNNEYTFDPDYLARIRPHVEFLAKEWGYDDPSATDSGIRMGA